ncbi:ubiquitin domain-containing UBFD1-like [Chlorella sorokiniana]|jgi:hypothetical protein|uniref:Ubiquitin domain-containing UBFD1-like n=1 Tax=Chlorella sorokiniana TaxID=3076 RepID=A0A2P6TVJ7_CHLSO|nr:ubiquitin domain-containing UBFD1-like [Chlorella sorokiniana]|eukprot:PRW58076.1 ubiquitin domain-containing UBFD1-like [Chlorella sorokiniana]
MADAAAPAAAAQQPEPNPAEAAGGATEGAAAAGGAAAGEPSGSGAEEQRKRELEEGETIAIKVTFGKQSVTTNRPLLSTVAELKADIAAQTGVPAENQKLLFKGQLKDEQTLQAAGLKSGSKIIVMGSKPEEIKVTALGKGTTGVAAGGDWDDKPASEPWSEQDQHKKVLAKGRPDDGWPGIRDKQVPLRDDQTYIPGLLNSQGTKVRLTFKAEVQQLWVGSATSTQKVPYNTVGKIESQAIKGQEEYSILRLQIGASGTSNLWLYYVPSQAVSGIKLRVLGVGALI